MYNQYLLTGATGFLGRAVAEELVRRGDRVRGGHRQHPGVVLGGVRARGP